MIPKAFYEHKRDLDLGGWSHVFFSHHMFPEALNMVFVSIEQAQE
jgi:hypothetical protein